MEITIKDIAKHAGVSPATVSRVMNNTANVSETTKKNVLAAVQKYNYSPNIFAKSLSRNESNTIGVVVPDITNPFFGEVIKGIVELVDKNNLIMILCDTGEDPKKEEDHLINLKSQRLKGLIITPTSDSNEFNSHYLSLLEDMGIPIILIDRDVKHSNFDGVFIDNVKGSFDATMKLIENGHKRIALISGPEDSKPGRDRKKGYIKALEISNIDIDEKIILKGDFKLDSGYSHTKAILNMKDRPSAIFCSNNMMTLGCIKALNEYNISVAKDISLIGFDDIEILNILDINITTVKRPTVEMGRIAMELLLERLANKDKDNLKRVILQAELILRGSEL